MGSVETRVYNADPAIAAAEKRCDEASAAWQKVNDAWVAADAERSRLLLLQIFEQHPNLQSVKLSLEYDHDHGHYSEYVSVDEPAATFDGTDADDVYDAVYGIGLTPETVRFMAGVDLHTDVVELTREQLQDAFVQSVPQT